MVVEVGKGSAGPAGGKRSVNLSLDPSYGYFTGALLRGGELTTTLVNFVGDCEEWVSESIEGASAPEIYAALAGKIGNHRDRASSRGGRYLGLGLAVASVVDAGGAVHPSADFPYELSELPFHLAVAAGGTAAWGAAAGGTAAWGAATGGTAAGYAAAAVAGAGGAATVVVENDANCAALFHHQRLSEPKGPILSIVFSHRPDSVGAGLLLDGALYRGKNGGAGEILPPGFEGSGEAVDELVAAAVRLTDPAVVVLAVDAGAPYPEGYQRLQEELSFREVVYVANPEASVRGAAFLAYQRALPKCVVSGKGVET
jgi:hypothetical protein